MRSNASGATNGVLSGNALMMLEKRGCPVRSFSSMARWNVSRHVPILPPYTSLIVAHAAPKGAGTAVLGRPAKARQYRFGAAEPKVPANPAHAVFVAKR